ncbi:MAG TPA: response regulator, partial [Lamprocystis sp. (in: g-proteobacteria)]|nr:response regulator [Lamprocystis sp. (in: g-proteobacteria)]
MSPATNLPPSAGATPATVVIVNDSAVARAVTMAVVQADGGFRLVGQAQCGLDGVELVRRLRPQLVLLDMHMPDIDGVEVTRRIMGANPTRVLITSATIRRNTTYVFAALKAGALDYTHTPALRALPGESVTRADLLAAGDGLLRKMRTVLSLRLTPVGEPGSGHAAGAARPAAPPVAAPATSGGTAYQPGVRVVAVGCSTGG